jgi:hypothetical protein
MELVQQNVFISLSAPAVERFVPVRKATESGTLHVERQYLMRGSPCIP